MSEGGVPPRVVVRYVMGERQQEAWARLRAADEAFRDVVDVRPVQTEPVHPSTAGWRLLEELVTPGTAARRTSRSRYRGVARRLGILSGRYAGAIAAFDPDAFTTRDVTATLTLPPGAPRPCGIDLERFVERRFRLAPTSAVIAIDVETAASDYRVETVTPAGPMRKRFYVERHGPGGIERLPGTESFAFATAQRSAVGAAEAAADRGSAAEPAPPPRFVVVAELVRPTGRNLFEAVLTEGPTTAVVHAVVASRKPSATLRAAGWVFFCVRHD
jgi:hypothetical protein